MAPDIDEWIMGALELRRDAFSTASTQQYEKRPRVRRSLVLATVAVVIAAAAIALAARRSDPAPSKPPVASAIPGATSYVSTLIKELPVGYRISSDPGPVSECDNLECTYVVDLSPPAGQPRVQIAVLGPAPGTPYDSLDNHVYAKGATAWPDIFYDSTVPSWITHVQMLFRHEFVDISSFEAGSKQTPVPPFSVEQLADMASGIRSAAQATG